MNVQQKIIEFLRRQLFAEPDVENDGVGVVEREGSDQSDDEEEYSDHETGSETSLEDLSERDEDVPTEEENENYIFGRDKETKWNVRMNIRNLRGRARRHNIIRGERVGVRLPCPKREAANVKSLIESWKLFFSDSLIDRIVQYPNVWIDAIKVNY